MAEKNTESTAVNQLIELVATQKPLPPDPSEDLMFSDKPRPRATKQMSPPRMTATVPPIKVAGEVAPLPPPMRVPTGTQQGLQTIKMPPPPRPNVRISTAPPSRSVTIPPVAAPMTLDDTNENELTNPEHDAMARVTKPTLPPPLPTVRGMGSTASRPSLPRPSIPTQSFDYPVVKHQAQALPVVEPYVAPPMSAPMVLENELVTSAALTNPSLPQMRFGADSTHQVPKAGDWKVIATKLVGPMIVLVIVGIFVGGYFAFNGDGGKKRKPTVEGPKVTMQASAVGDVAKADEPKAEPAAEPVAKADEPKAEPAAEPTKVEEPKAEPVAKTEEPKVEPKAAVEPAKAVVEPAKTEPAKTEPAKTPAVPPALVDIRVDSNPSGATVNLIDRGKSMYLGTTPLSAAVDASRKYELVFSYENRATVIESLDPATQKRVSVKLSRSKHGSSSAPKTELPKIETPKAEAKTERHHRSSSAKTEETSKLAEPQFDEKKIEEKKVEEKPAKAEPAAKAAPAGEGTLMISSKPPCEILIDGKSTGLTTPQRAIPLPAGAHKVTLVNSAEGIKKTVSVQITADKPTKVIQDLMK